MLSYNLTGDILEVVETLHSWTDTKISYWYYDIKQWMVSSFGKQNDIPDRLMTEAGKEWVKKYYLPKVQEQ